MTGVSQHSNLAKPFTHPEWQGSVPSKWMDRSNGHQRGPKFVSKHLRDGQDGIAAQGLGGYMADAAGRLHEESLRGRACTNSRHLPFGSPEREQSWRPGKRFPSPPIKVEPNRLSRQPSFPSQEVSKVSRPIKLHSNSQEQHVKGFVVQRADRTKTTAVEEEAEAAKQMVQQLVDWERTHVRDSFAATGDIKTPFRSAIASHRSAALPTLASPPTLLRSSSDVRFDVTRYR